MCGTLTGFVYRLQAWQSRKITSKDRESQAHTSLFGTSRLGLHSPLHMYSKSGFYISQGAQYLFFYADLAHLKLSIPDFKVLHEIISTRHGQTDSPRFEGQFAQRI